MENPSRPFRRTQSSAPFFKKLYTGHGFAAKGVYDGIFGGPPMFGVPSLSPCMEDYREIFGGFHASLASSIPVLDLPAVSENGVLFDLQSSTFDYSDVFGGFNGIDFAVSYEQLLERPEGRDDSSDEAWTPTEPEYLSEESDSSAHVAMHKTFSNGDPHHLFDHKMQFDDSCHRNSEDISSRMDHGTHLRSISEILIVDDESSSLQTNEERKTSLKATDVLNVYTDLNNDVMGQKHFRKCKSLPPKDNAGPWTFGSGSKDEKRYYDVGHPNETFVTISKLQPASEDEKGDFTNLTSNHETPTNCAHVGTPLDSSLPFFDVEVDPSYSAAVTATAMKDSLDKAREELRSAKEFMDRKKEVVQNSVNLGSENDVKDMEWNVGKMVDGSKTLVKDEVENCETDDTGVNVFVGQQIQGLKEISDIFTDAIEEENLLSAAEMSEHKGRGNNSKDSHTNDGTGEWAEAMEFYELRRRVRGAGDWKKNSRTIKEGKEAHEGYKNEYSSRAAKVTHSQEHAKNAKGVKADSEWKENEQKSNIGQKHNMYEEGLTEVDKWEEHQKLIMMHEVEFKDAVKFQESNLKLKHGFNRFEHENCIKEGKSEESEKIGETGKREIDEKKFEKDFEKAEREKGLLETLKEEENDMKIFKEVPKWGELNFGRGEDERAPKNSLEWQQNKNKEVLQNREDKRSLKEVFGLKDNGKDLKNAILLEGGENKQLHAHEGEVTEKRHKETCEVEKLEKRLEEAWRREENEILKEARERKRTGKKSREASEWEKVEDRSKEPGKFEKTGQWLKDTEDQNKLKALHTFHGQSGRAKNAKKLKLAHKNSLLLKGENLKLSGETPKQGDFMSLGETKEACKHEGSHGKLEIAQLGSACEENENVRIKGKDDRKLLGAVKMAKTFTDEEFGETGMSQFHLKPEVNEIRMKYSGESLTSRPVGFDSESVERNTGHDWDGQVKNARRCQVFGPQNSHNSTSVLAHQVKEKAEIGKTAEVRSTVKQDSDSESVERNTSDDWDGKGKNARRCQVFGSQNSHNSTSVSSHHVKEKAEIGKTAEVQSTVMQGRGNTQKIAQQFNLNHIRYREDKKITRASEEKEKEVIKREQELEKGRLREMEEEREREREKDTMAVEIATCEARERAQRAAVVKANAEAREKALVEARERLEKERAREKSEMVSKEGRLKVERETAEAQEYAVETQAAKGAPYDTRERVEADKNSVSFRDVRKTQTMPSSDLQSWAYSSGFTHQSASGIDIESAQRCRARLERHHRTSERAAKALAEKNMRDLLAQREQAERTRLAETLDAEIRRWSNGKEGNLRALLSTLQYILGTGNGWQPIPLTDIVTTAAVKKAYRKAALCVHPDKLQQRGASIRQKYLCEKVFDLLKEAWNKFNSEEQ